MKVHGTLQTDLPVDTLNLGEVLSSDVHLLIIETFNDIDAIAAGLSSDEDL